MHFTQVAQSTDDELLIPVRKACARLGCGRSKLYKLVRAGKLRLVAFEGRSSIPADSLRAYVNSLQPIGEKAA